MLGYTHTTVATPLPLSVENTTDPRCEIVISAALAELFNIPDRECPYTLKCQKIH